MQIHVNGPEVGTKQFDNLINVAVDAWHSKSRRKLKYGRMIRNQALASQDANSTGEMAEIVVLPKSRQMMF